MKINNKVFAILPKIPQQSSKKVQVSGNAEFKSLHKLSFEVAPSPYNVDKKVQFMLFRVGTCEGLWRCAETSYDILAITNSQKGNGHFEDVLQWFEQSCRRDKKSLKILEVWNSRFKAHLTTKRNFKDIGGDNVLKNYDK